MTVFTVPSARISFGLEEREAVLRVLDSGRVVQGPEVGRFEAEFAALVDGRTCVAVNSGTSALHLALLAAGIGAGDEVIVPSFSFAATANAVAMTGARPVFADIDSRTYCLSPSSVAERLSARTAAVIPVHLYGQLADMVALRDLADAAGLLLLEDAAQAHGAAMKDRPAGAWGELAAFSFYATKNMTTGEGGMVVCDDAEHARLVRLLRNQGMERQYENEVAGLNNRMTDIAAAIGRVQLPKLHAFNDRRIEIAQRYDAGLAGLPGVTTPYREPEGRHVYHQYTVGLQDRERVRFALEAKGVEGRVFYPTPIHRLPAFETRDDLPVTEHAASTVLSLPVHPSLTDAEVDYVIASMVTAVRGQG